ncbi:MAG: lmo0937 family membrane protein [Blastocatellia bacterium]|nr:lmo0937 family membrane protein [Blastocatellia bacterium]
MLWTIVIILLVLWALGFGFAGQAVGSLIHILLVVAAIVVVLSLVRGRGSV